MNDRTIVRVAAVRRAVRVAGGGLRAGGRHVPGDRDRVEPGGSGRARAREVPGGVRVDPVPTAVPGRVARAPMTCAAADLPAPAARVLPARGVPVRPARVPIGRSRPDALRHRGPSATSAPSRARVAACRRSRGR